MPKRTKPLKIADILEQQLDDPVMRERANAEFQKHAAGFRASFTDTRAAVSQVLARTLVEIAWFQQVPFVVDYMAPRPPDGRDTYELQQARLHDAMDRLENAQVEQLREQVAAAVRERLIDRLRSAIPRYLSAPSELNAPQKLAISDGGAGDPVRGQLRSVADEGYRPAPLDRRTGESMGREKPKDE